MQRPDTIWKSMRYISSLMRSTVFGALPNSSATLLPRAPVAVQLCATMQQQRHSMQQSEAAGRASADSPMVHASINGRGVDVPKGVSILEAARSLSIHIPTLCTHPRLVLMGSKPPGTCRLCLVETADGRLRPACATPVEEGMDIATDSPAVRDNITAVLRLLRANHPDDCMTCDSNGRCEFQDLVSRYDVQSGLLKHRDFSHEWDEPHVGESPALAIDLDKCIKCGRCVAACNAVQHMDVLGMLGRNAAAHPGKLDEAPLDLSKCIECGQCAAVCPTDAIHEVTQWRKVLAELAAKRRVSVVQTAPAVRVAIGEELGLAPGSVTTGQLVTALRTLGFDYVFDTNFSADLTVLEEAAELVARLQEKWAAEDAGDAGAGPAMPMFSSCCPAWVTAVEKSYPELLPQLSSCKSPQMMLGAVVRRVWAAGAGVDPDCLMSVSVMPCTAKKAEAAAPKFAPGGRRDVDYVLTTRELGQMLRQAKIPLASLPSAPYDSPLGASTGAAALFGASGGVAEAALRTVYYMATGEELADLELTAVRGLQGIKEAEVTFTPRGSAKPRTVRLAVAGGIGSARHLLERMRQGEVQYDFVEVMACPGGCIGGGGQPKNRDPLALIKRINSIYELDRSHGVRQSHNNADIITLYRQSLAGGPNGPAAHALLHTHYGDRSHDTLPRYSTKERREAEEAIADLLGLSKVGQKE